MRLVNHPGRIPSPKLLAIFSPKLLAIFSPKLLAMLPRAVASLFLITLMVPSAVYADLVYDVMPYRVSTFRIDGGSIAVSDMAADDGILRGDEVRSFTFYGSGPTGDWQFSDTSIPPDRLTVTAAIGRVVIERPPYDFDVVDAIYIRGFSNQGLLIDTSLSLPNSDLLQYRSANDSGYSRAIILRIDDLTGSRRGPLNCQPWGGGPCYPGELVVATRSAIPEPSPVPLMGLVTAGLFGYRRRKRKLANVKS